MLHHICTLVQDEDLQNLLLIQHVLASIACDVNVKRLGIRQDTEKRMITPEGGLWALGNAQGYSQTSKRVFSSIAHSTTITTDWQRHKFPAFVISSPQISPLPHSP